MQAKLKASADDWSELVEGEGIKRGMSARLIFACVMVLLLIVVPSLAMIAGA